MKKEFDQRIYNLVLKHIKFLKTLPQNTFSYEITKQALRSGCSIGANYFESRGALSPKDFKNFFAISLKSANETLFWLKIIGDLNIVSAQLRSEHSELIKEIEEIAKILASSMITMKKREI